MEIFSASDLAGGQVVGGEPAPATSTASGFPIMSVSELNGATAENPIQQAPTPVKHDGFLGDVEGAWNSFTKSLPGAFASTPFGMGVSAAPQVASDLSKGLAKVEYQNQHSTPSVPLTPAQLNAQHEMGIVPSQPVGISNIVSFTGGPTEPGTTGEVYNGPLTKAKVNLGSNAYDAKESPLVNFLESNTPAEFVKNELNAPLLNRLKMDATNAFVNAKGILANPQAHTPQQVRWATSTVAALKNNGNWLGGVKSMFQQAYKDPAAFGIQSAEFLVQHPEMLLVGFGAPEGAVAKLATGAAEGAAGNIPYNALQARGSKGYTTRGDLESAAGQGAAFGLTMGAVHGAAGAVGDVLGKEKGPIPTAGPTPEPTVEAPGGGKGTFTGREG